jgi:hypothetical protein
MWGIFPFGSSILAILVVMIPEKKQLERRAERPVFAEENLAQERRVS